MIPIAIGMPGGPELLVILFLVMLLFGAKRLPDLARSMGRSLSEFKRGKQEGIESGGDAEDADATTTEPAEKANAKE